jgi:hypothetical protein
LREKVKEKFIGVEINMSGKAREQIANAFQCMRTKLLVRINENAGGSRWAVDGQIEAKILAA